MAAKGNAVGLLDGVRVAVAKLVDAEGTPRRRSVGEIKADPFAGSNPARNPQFNGVVSDPESHW